MVKFLAFRRISFENQCTDKEGKISLLILITLLKYLIPFHKSTFSKVLKSLLNLHKIVLFEYYFLLKGKWNVNRGIFKNFNHYWFENYSGKGNLLLKKQGKTRFRKV